MGWAGGMCSMSVGGRTAPSSSQFTFFSLRQSCARGVCSWDVVPRQPEPAKLGCPCRPPLTPAELQYPASLLRPGFCRPGLDPVICLLCQACLQLLVALAAGLHKRQCWYKPGKRGSAS